MRATHCGLLALDAGAVEPQCWDTVCVPLDMEDAFIVPLSGLWLGQVLGQQSDWPHNTSRDVDLSGRQDLRTLLEKKEQRSYIIVVVVSTTTTILKIQIT